MMYSATFDPAHLCSQICSPKLVRVAPESPGKDNRLWQLGIASLYRLNLRGYGTNQGNLYTGKEVAESFIFKCASGGAGM